MTPPTFTITITVATPTETTTPTFMLTRSDIWSYFVPACFALGWSACLWLLLGPAGVEWSWGVPIAAFILGGPAAMLATVPLFVLWCVADAIIEAVRAARHQPGRIS